MTDPSAAAVGIEYVVEAYGCRTELLTSVERMGELVERIIAECELHPVAPAVWHRFVGTGGVTGMVVLAESHLACHTYPEFGSVTLNLFCCRPRPRWDFERRLAHLTGAERVAVRELERALAAPAATATSPRPPRGFVSARSGGSIA